MKHKLKQFLPTACRRAFKAGKADTPCEGCRNCWADGVISAWRNRIKQLAGNK
jgi:hypothetical protein